MESDHLSQHLVKPENFKRFQQESLLLDVASLIHRTMRKESVTPKQLAERLGVTKGRISQYLGGERNLRLRTLADIFTALGCRFRVDADNLSDGIVWQSAEMPITQLPQKWIVVDECRDSAGPFQLAG